MGKPRLPWKRGPAAWKVACASDDIKNRLHAQPRKYLSLRRTAKLFRISTQPIRDWIRLGHLKREGPRRQIVLGELERFIEWLERRAKPFSAENYTERFIRKTGRYPYRFQTLSRAQFIWPKGQKALTPKELAELIGCHPSLITKAIHARRWIRLGRRKSSARKKNYSWETAGSSSRCCWVITRRSWQNAFPLSTISDPRLPRYHVRCCSRQEKRHTI